MYNEDFLNVIAWVNYHDWWIKINHIVLFKSIVSNPSSITQYLMFELHPNCPGLIVLQLEKML